MPVVTAAADVTDTPALSGAVSDIATAIGGLDYLVANAGGTVGANLADSAPGDFAATFALNAGHAAELIRAGLPYLRAADGAAVVIISSITGMRPAPRTTYAVAKAAEIHLAATAAAELAPWGIRVNAVSPGSILFPGGPGRRSARIGRRRSPPSSAPSSRWGASAVRRRWLTWSHSCSRAAPPGSPEPTSWSTAARATRAPGISGRAEPSGRGCVPVTMRRPSEW